MYKTWLAQIYKVVYSLKIQRVRAHNPYSQGTGHPVQPRLLASYFAETTQSTLHIHIFILPHFTFDHMHLWPADFL